MFLPKEKQFQGKEADLILFLPPPLQHTQTQMYLVSDLYNFIIYVKMIWFLYVITIQQKWQIILGFLFVQ